MRLKFEPNSSKPSHEDLYVSIPELDIEQWTDTYYFLVDSGFMPNEETDDKVIILLKILLQEWINAVDQLEDNDIAFLPFDFSDQYIGALKIQRQGSDVLIRYAWNRKMGGMSPSYYKDGLLLDENFNVYLNSAKIPLMKFINQIEEQLEM